jgi:LacI family transcriptional regulator
MSVSRALRNDGHVSDRLAARIRSLADEMGYEPDPALSALARYRQRLRDPKERAVAAFLTNDSSRVEYKENPLIVQVIEGAARRGRELGYRVEPAWLPDLSKRHRDPSDALIARGIRGIILARLPRVNMPLGIDWARFSCVSFGYSLQKPAFDYVASHLFQDMCLAFSRAVELGYKRPGFVYSDDFDARTLQQMHGAFLLKQETLLKVNRIPVLRTRERFPDEDLRHYLASHRPDVIMAPWPHLLGSLHRMGKHPPGDIGFIDMNLAGMDSEISGIYQSWPRIGRAAMDRLNMLLQDNRRGVPDVPEGTTIYGNWVPGKTVVRQPAG